MINIDRYLREKIDKLKTNSKSESSIEIKKDYIKEVVDEFYDQILEKDSYREPSVNEFKTIKIDKPTRLLDSQMIEDDKNGYAIFDNGSMPKKRYYLEKKWKKDGEMFTAILMNPSYSDSISTDTTVLNLYRYARYYSHDKYNSIVIVNLTPEINPDSNKLNKKIDEKQLKFNLSFLKYALENSNDIFIGWGKKGQDFFKDYILFDCEIRKLLSAPTKNFKAMKVKCIRIKKKFKESDYPKHPSRGNSIDFSIKNIEENFMSANGFLKYFCNKYENK